MIAFCVSGLWHGASWSYVAWGALNGYYQVIGDYTNNFRNNAKRFLRINTQCWLSLFPRCNHLFSGGFFVAVFRANRLKTAFRMLRHMLRSFGLVSMLDSKKILGVATLSLDEKDFSVLLIAIILLAVIGFLKDRIDLRAALLRQNLVFRYAVYYCILFVILIFGVYGPGFDASTFIYFQF